VVNIEPFAFSYCGFGEIGIPSTVNKIKTQTFHGCRNLYVVYIPDSVKHIAKNALGSKRQVNICTPEGSYAQKFAEENGYKVIVK
jgi:hypothetical protein